MELFDVDAARVAREVNWSFAGRSTQIVGALCIAVIVIRGMVASLTPLSADEAYYWLWSKHLASGYYDHPPLIAFIIRAGTALFGDTSFGVRFVPFLLAAAASWAVWRAGTVLLGNVHGGAIGALLFNVMPMIGVESLAATPDAAQIAAAAFLLFTLVKVGETGHGPWWVAAGIAGGIGLLSKYTGFFLGAGILLWLAWVPKQRHWLISFWPYLGAAIAVLLFLPVVFWNAQHGWISFALQFGRVGGGVLTLRYLAEFLGAQLVLASPFIAILGTAGLLSASRAPAVGANLALLPTLAAPAILYFVWHSLHDRVQGNWPSFLYPAFAVAAAAAYVGAAGPHAARVLRVSRRFAIPVAAAMVALIYAQGLWGVIPRVRDPVSRLLAVGMNRVVYDIESLRARTGADAVITTNYALTGWLSFYLPSHPPVIQLNERYRYLNEPPPAPQLFGGPLLYVTLTRNDESHLLAERFAKVRPLAHIARYRNGATIDEYEIYSVEGPTGPPLAQGR